MDKYVANFTEVNEDFLEHYGTKRHSGRYPYGSGDNPYQHEGLFLRDLKRMQSDGMTEKQIADYFKLSTTQLRTQISLAKAEDRAYRRANAIKLREKGFSLKQIAKEMGYPNDSSVRALLDEEVAARKNVAKDTAEFLKKQVEEKGMIDLSNADNELHISKEKLNQALYILELEGYPHYSGRVPQVTNPGKQTTQMVLCPPGTEHKEIYKFENVNTLVDYISTDDGKTFHKAFEYPASMDSKRLQVVYAEDGGTQKDGVIELRRGVEDLSLGNSLYAQVRIMVDNTHYLKGMAVYADDLPKGVDVRFNTNKSKGTPVLGEKDNTVLKQIKSDPDNPFGSLIKEKGGQYYYTDKDGNEKLGLINKRSEEGDWMDWQDKIPSQFLAKQNQSLIKQQLDLSIVDYKTELAEISALTNPTVKKARLESYANDCDSAAVHLKAAALPRQKYNVILPLTSIKDNEIYAPNFKDGETVALVRYPHAGTFEIPILKVNNKNKEGNSIITKGAKDAVGINAKVASQLSGADFDGDTVAVIPCNSQFSKTKISARPPLAELVNFDPHVEYAKTPGMRVMTKAQTQKEMGTISNLIMDMTLRGASDSEMARAVKHSMVIIDAEKHKLDYKRSEIENNIGELKRSYQSKKDPVTGKMSYGGASTLLTLAKNEARAPKVQGSPKITPEGNLEYKISDKTYTTKESNIKYKANAAKEYASEVTSLKKKVNAAQDSGSKVKITDSEYKAIQAGAFKPSFLAALSYRTNASELAPRSSKDKTIEIYDSEPKTRTQKSTRMAEASDARDLISPYRAPAEVLYADYANTLKALGRTARKEILATPNLKYDRAAATKYSSEVKSLESKFQKAEANKPKELAAQRMANVEIERKKRTDPDLENDKAMLKKVSQQALTKARETVGAKRTPIVLTDKEWEAIQSGAVSENKLQKMIRYIDADELRERSTPSTQTGLRPAQISKLKAMSARGFSSSEIADALGISSSTVLKYLK